MDTMLNIGAFIRVARLGSFSAAAREMNAVPSVITKRVSQLEKEVGVKLISRSTRGLALTADGERYLPRFVRLMAEHDEIFHASQPKSHAVEGLLRIQTPPTVTSMFLGKLLTEFQRKYPRVDMDIVLMERSVNPLEEGFDLAIGAWPISYPNVIDVPLCPYELVTVCSPSYLSGRAPPQHPTELVDHQCLTTVLFRTTWGFTHPRGSMHIEVHSHLQSSDSRMVCDAARAGMGIAILPKFLIDEDLRTGTLVPLLQEFPVTSYWVKAWVPRIRMNRAAVRELTKFLKISMQPESVWKL